MDLAYAVLGHSSFDVTKKYLRFAPSEIQERYRRANILGAMRQPKKLSMRDVDKVLRRKQIGEGHLSELLFEVEVKEG